MPRPKLHSDQAILDTAQRVLLERGPLDFTLSDVASAVGISRAALIQRFTNREGLLRRVAQREVDLTRKHLSSLTATQDLQHLWRFLCDIVSGMGAGDDFGVRVLIAWQETRDPALKQLARERYGLVQQAIADRLPDSVPERTAIARHLHAVIAGATMQWLVEDHTDLPTFVLKRLAFALEALFPEHEFQQQDRRSA